MTNRIETRRNRGIRRSIVLRPFESDGGGAASDEVEEFRVDASRVDVERVDDLGLFGAAEHERQQSEAEVAVVALPVVCGAAHDLGDHQVEARPEETEL